MIGFGESDTGVTVSAAFATGVGCWSGCWGACLPLGSLYAGCGQDFLLSRLQLLVKNTASFAAVGCYLFPVLRVDVQGSHVTLADIFRHDMLKNSTREILGLLPLAIDHVISPFENRFPEEHLLLAFCLLPSNVHELTDDDRENIKEEFLQDLPSPASYDQELDRWQQRTQKTRADDKRQQLTDLLGSPAVVQFHPTVHAVLSLLLTLPAGSCSCERSFSALRRLKDLDEDTNGEGEADCPCTVSYASRVPGGHLS